MLSQTLGTALGDWIADSAGLGYRGGMVVFGALLAVVVVLYCGTRLFRIEQAGRRTDAIFKAGENFLYNMPDP